LRTVKLYFYGLLVLLFVVFIVQNYSTLTYSVSLRLNLGFLSLESVPLPFFLIVPLIFFAGVLLATLIGLAERRRLSKELKQVKNDLRDSGPRPSTHETAIPGSIPSSETENPPSDVKPPVQS
jgi:lipopolysaccharide assembly protein A